VFEYAWLILLFPLFAFLIVGLVGRRLPQGGGHVAVGGIAASLVVSGYLFWEVLGQGALGGEVHTTVDGYVWIPGIEGLAGSQAIHVGLLIDNLSALMLLLVSFLCLLIFVYSLGYMREEEGKHRYYAEVSLFSAGMLGTVSADNFLQLMVFWEIMGLCSYLLIGFWYHKPEAAKAAKKAFLVTRVGDVIFLVGILVIWNTFHTLVFDEIVAQMADSGSEGFAALLAAPQLLTIIPLLLFGGAIGKSAQFPLHAWLPDAMEGPATVSALIHAATMVKAGVYLTARSFIFLVPPAALPLEAPTVAILVIAVVGGFTAFFAGTMALTAYDIKRVLAFSTISQLAYMFLGLGAGAWLLTHGGETLGYTAALFHLFNHAFFKALLFLSAGSVIHAVHTNDMREMGGLARHLPITSKVMLVGSLALAGIVPFSGFFSKGEVLSATFEAAHEAPVFYLLYALGVLTALLTAFYTFRMWLMTFHGEYRGQGHPHESPAVMTAPLVVLAGFAVASGLLAYGMNGFGNLVFFGEPHAQMPLVGVPLAEYALEGLTLGVALLGIVLAWSVYATRRIPAERFTAAPSGAFLHRLLSRRYGIDDLYDAIGAKAVAGLARALDWFDRNVVDGVVNVVGRGGLAAAAGTDAFDRRVVDGAVNALSLETVRASWRLRQRQTGQVQTYAWMVVFGIVIVIVLVVGVSWFLRLQRGG